MKVLKGLYFSTIFLISSLTSFAQSPLQLDTTFRVDMNGQPYNKYVGDLWIEDDGSIIIVGGFEHLYYPGNYPRVCVKLDGLGKLDTQFQYQHPYSGTWATKIAHHNGMYYLGHYSHPGVNRIYPDGTIDTSFRFPMDSFWLGDVQVSGIFVQSDGKVLVSGHFTLEINQYWGLIRLNHDGSIDTSFHSNIINKPLLAFHLLESGKILVAGEKSDMMLTRMGLWRVHNDGTLDSAFNPGIASGYCHGLRVQEDGKILARGRFHLNGIPNTIELCRFNSDGSLDSTFNYLNNFNLALGKTYQIGDKVFITGKFREVNGRPYNRIAVLDTNGNLDTLWFGPGFGPDSTSIFKDPSTYYIKEQDGKILVHGAFNSFSGFSSFCLVRLHGLTAGLNEVEKGGSMHCFPNPVSGEVNIKVEQALSGTYRLLDMSGRLLYSAALYPAQKHHQISLPNLAPGLYLLQLSSKDGKEYCEKLVVR